MLEWYHKKYTPQKTEKGVTKMAFIKVKKHYNDLVKENEYTIINTDGIIAMQDYIKGLYLVEMANDKTVLLDEEEAKKVFEAIGVSLP